MKETPMNTQKTIERLDKKVDEDIITIKAKMRCDMGYFSEKYSKNKLKFLESLMIQTVAFLDGEVLEMKIEIEKESRKNELL